MLVFFRCSCAFVRATRSLVDECSMGNWGLERHHRRPGGELGRNAQGM